MHRFGQNLAHAPGFFVGFTALAGFLLARSTLCRIEARIVYFAFLGALMAFFDLIHGSIPVILSLSIVLNQLFYVSPDAKMRESRPAKHYVLSTIGQAIGIFLCFFLAYALLTVLRLGALAFIGEGSWLRYEYSLVKRLGDQVPGHTVVIRDVMEKLWQARYQLSPGGTDAAMVGLLLSVAAWIFVAGLLATPWKQGDPDRHAVLIDVALIVLVSVGVCAWYWVFLQHTYVHSLFVVRIAALPAAYGLVAAVLLVHARAGTRTSALVSAEAGLAVIALAIASVALDGGLVTLKRARFVPAPSSDLVSCAPLGLRPDGRTDHLIVASMNTRQASPLLAMLGVRPGPFDSMSLTLERKNPPGWWDTGSENYIIGVSLEPTGAVINRPDGTIVLPSGRASALWLHFCDDGADRPESTFRLHAGSTFLDVPMAR
jgi:hypothetical protein